MSTKNYLPTYVSREKSCELTARRVRSLEQRQRELLAKGTAQRLLSLWGNRTRWACLCLTQRMPTCWRGYDASRIPLSPFLFQSLSLSHRQVSRCVLVLARVSSVCLCCPPTSSFPRRLRGLGRGMRSNITQTQTRSWRSTTFIRHVYTRHTHAYKITMKLRARRLYLYAILVHHS